MNPPPYGCNCDPGEPPDPGHSLDCPAYEVEARAVAKMRRHLPLFEQLAAEMDRQHRNYGAFAPDVPGVRLAAAALEDEAEEVRRAWRDERKVEGWTHTAEEALQVAAVASRLVAALDDKCEPAGEGS